MIPLAPKMEKRYKKKVWKIKQANNQATEKMRLVFLKRIDKVIQVGNYSDR